MKRHLYLVALALFLVTLVYDALVWGALPLLPGVGPAIEDSAHRQAPLASTYIAFGRAADGAVPLLQSFGERRLVDALRDGFPRISEDSTVAMDLIFGTTWNSHHRWLKTMYWAPPLFLLLGLALWLLRPRRVRALARR